MEAIAVAAISSIPPTLAALAAWRNARLAKVQTNGPVTEMRADLADLKADVRDLKADVRVLKARRN